MIKQTFYCVRCRGKKEGTGLQEIIMKNGKKAYKAECVVCGTTMFKIGDPPSPKDKWAEGYTLGMQTALRQNSVALDIGNAILNALDRRYQQIEEND